MRRRQFLSASLSLGALACAGDSEAFSRQAKPAPVKPAPVKPAPGGGRRFALLVGVNGYEAAAPKTDKPLWPNLNTSPDLRAIATALERFGFVPSDLTVLSAPGQTTRAAILAALSALADRVRPGDMVYIHYSGHGGASADGKTQTLVPSDWFDPADPGDRNQSRHIDGATLAARITAIKNRLQGSDRGARVNLTIVLDCCHSGHLLADVRGKGGPQVRGRNLAADTAPAPILTAPTLPKALPPDGDGALPASVYSGVRGFVGLLACRYREVAIEVEPGTGGVTMGLLTHALVESLKTCPPESTYDDLLLRVANRVVTENPDQHPVLIGDGANRVFQGAARRDPPHFTVRKASATELEVDAGRTRFVTPETLFSLYPVGTSPKKMASTTPIATAKPAPGGIGLTKTSLKLVTGEMRALTNGAWATSERLVGNMAMLVALDAAPKAGGERDAETRELTPAERKLFARALASPRGDALAEPGGRARAVVELVAVARGYELRRIGATGANARVARLDGRGRVLDGETIPGDLPDGEKAALFAAAVNRIARVQLLRTLAAERSLGEAAPDDPTGIKRHSGVAVDLRLIPVNVEAVDKSLPPGPGNARYVSEKPGDPAKKRDWAVGEWFAIEVRHIGTDDCYISVFDIDPNGWVAAIYPPPATRAAPMTARDDKWRKLNVNGAVLVFRVAPPIGLETMHLIATPASDGEVDLTPLADSNPYDGQRSDTTVTRGASLPIGRLLMAARDGQRAGVAERLGNCDSVMFPYNVVTAPGND